MKRICAVVFWLLLSTVAWGQVHLRKLVLKPHEVYELKGTDILVVDSLIMMESSKIILNKLKPANFIHAKAAVFHKGSYIDGRGVVGLKGQKGADGTSPQNPCADGGSGATGADGTYGGHGTNLSMYIGDIYFKGNLTIDVSGGDGGEGGDGGNGGGGGPGTRICKGGHGGDGGNGSAGGNGGNSGTLTLVAPRIPELRIMLGDKIMVNSYGGNGGLGGEGGGRGLSGLSPVGNNKLDGKAGKKGAKGKDGLPGKPGAINVQDKS
ncbi:hypothetical protein BH10BAC4_BH10BAC4_04310 [soil metagenome]